MDLLLEIRSLYCCASPGGAAGGTALPWHSRGCAAGRSALAVRPQGRQAKLGQLLDEKVNFKTKCSKIYNSRFISTGLHYGYQQFSRL